MGTHIIRGAINGVILKSEDGEILYQSSDDEEEGDDIEMFADFLRTILDSYGPVSSRYSPKRIYITIGPGDKFKPEEK